VKLNLIRPDDWHLHLRDGEMLDAVVATSAKDFARAIIMPNLVPPVVTGEDAIAYRTRIESAVERAGYASKFTPLMTLYLTEKTDPHDVVDAATRQLITAVKLYPAGATTNSASGVTSIDKVMPVLEAMSENGIMLCVHGEVTDSEIDIFDREARFIETVLEPLRSRLPELKIVMEHVTTSDGIDYILQSDKHLAGTITPHHLMINRNHLLVGGIRPHYYCLPVAKRESHRLALVRAAVSGDSRFFLGTDSAPHVKSLKENACGCAGVFNAGNTMSCLATVFEEADALEHLEAFASTNGPDWYGLPRNSERITLERRDEPLAVTPPVIVGDDVVVTFDPGRPVYWHVVSSH